MSSSSSQQQQPVPILHLIEDEGNFADSSKVESFFTRFPQTTNYHTLAVFGGQGTGKSTLLNKLFNTSFATMREDGGRSQTTRGAFASLIRDSSSPSSSQDQKQSHEQDPLLLIVDFEGTDGMERGEDQSFEKKLALFAVACADVVVINMFSNEIGRFNAANLSLLRTVFELNLNVFQKAKLANENEKSASPSSKNTLFFVIRDFTSGTLEGNSDVMTRALTQIWEKVAKPSGLEDAKIEDYFNLKFACLPHYVLQRDKFDLEVSLLKGAFLQNADTSDESIQAQLDSSSENSSLHASASTGLILNLATTYVFEGKPHCSTGIPIHDNVTYLANVWDTVKNQKDLDIPSQRLLVAQLRSQEVSDELLKSFNKRISAFHDELDAGMIRTDIAQTLEQIREQYTEEFNQKLQLYLETSPAVSTARYNLEKTMKVKSRDLFKRFALHLAKGLIRANDTAILLLVTRAIDNMIPKLTEAWLDDLVVVASGSGAAPPLQSPLQESAGVSRASSFSNAYGGTVSSSAAVSPRTPQLGAVDVSDENRPSAEAAFTSLEGSGVSSSGASGALADDHNNNNNKYSDPNSSSSMMMERKESRLLSDVKRMNDMKSRLNQVQVSKYVTKFWGFIMREIDAVVADLQGSVKKYQRQTKLENEIKKEIDQGNDGEDNTKNKNNNKRSEDNVIILATKGNDDKNQDNNSTTSTDTFLREIGKAFVDDDDAITLVFKYVTSGFEERVRERVRNMTSDPANTATRYFERHLYHTEDGSTRHFTTKQQLEDSYRLAHTGGLLLLACLAVFRGRYYSNVDGSNHHHMKSNNHTNSNNFDVSIHGDINNSSEEDSPNNSNRSASQTQQQVQQEVFLLHFTKAMEQYHVRYVFDESFIAGMNSKNNYTTTNNDSSSSSSSNNNTTNIDTNANTANTTSSSIPNTSDRNSIVLTFDFPAALPHPSKSNETMVTSVDPGVKALHEFHDRFVMLSDSSFRYAFDMFMQRCNFTYQLQVRQLERDAASGAPNWMVGLLAFFVLREAMYIFADPVLLIVTIGICYVFLREWIKGQYGKFIETGPTSVTVPLKLAVDKIMEIVHNITSQYGGGGGKVKQE